MTKDTLRLLYIQSQRHTGWSGARDRLEGAVLQPGLGEMLLDTTRKSLFWYSDEHTRSQKTFYQLHHKQKCFSSNRAYGYKLDVFTYGSISNGHPGTIEKSGKRWIRTITNTYGGVKAMHPSN